MPEPTALQKINAEMFHGCRDGYELHIDKHPLYPESTRYHADHVNFKVFLCTAPTIEHLAEALEVAREEIAKVQHANDCEFVTRFIHTEPCPFWTQYYCLVDDKCIHGLPMGDQCHECVKTSIMELQLVFADGAERCHPVSCNCWKSRAERRIEQALKGYRTS